jgi:hypothetical protein
MPEAFCRGKMEKERKRRKEGMKKGRENGKERRKKGREQETPVSRSEEKDCHKSCVLVLFLPPESYHTH